MFIMYYKVHLVLPGEVYDIVILTDAIHNIRYPHLPDQTTTIHHPHLPDQTTTGPLQYSPLY